MLNGLDPSQLSNESVDMDLLRSRISTGNAVLFTGAGFSLDCENLAKSTPPLASKLANNLCNIANIKESNNLKFASDYALRYGDKQKILEMLRKNYELTTVPNYIKDICDIPWRRIYTTNYDNSIELGHLDNKRGIHSLSLSDEPSKFLKNENSICLHLNGVIKNAIVDDLAYKIKLSDSSYLSADFFLKSKWRSVFNKDVEHCSALIFVGYSLYDVDIEKILYDRPHLANKTYFITDPEADLEDVYKLSSYGYVSKIATKGFGNFIKDISFKPENDKFPQHFKKIATTEKVSVLDHFSTRELLLYGKYSSIDVETAFKGGFCSLYMIERTKMYDVINHLKNKKHVLIQSDLGNGKSVLIDQIAILLANDGFKIWKLQDIDGNPCKDLELFSSNENHILIIDDISGLSELFEYFSAINPGNLTFLLSDRTINEFDNIKNLVGENIIIESIDTLDKLERLQLIRILEDQNMWKKYTGLSEERKDSIIVDKYESQISNILIGLLESPEIRSRISKILSELTSNPEYKKALFTISMFDIFGIKKDAANVAEISGNESLLTFTFRNTEACKTILSYGENNVILKSSVLSLFIMNNFFTESYIVDQCLEIMERIDKLQSPHIMSIKSKLLTFHNVEKLIPQKQASLNNYFGELKRRCIWLQKHPHFWVQYAMCRLSFEDTEIAQEHLNTAYRFASLKNDYHTENIDTQQARLYLMKAIEENIDESESARLFNEADKLLNYVTNDNRKFRQVLKYKDIYEKVYTKWVDKNQVSFEHKCNHMIKQAKEAIENSNNIEKIRHIYLSNQFLNEIVGDIKNRRSL